MAEQVLWSLLVEMPGWKSSASEDIGALAEARETQPGIVRASVMGPAERAPGAPSAGRWLRPVNAWREWRFARAAPSAFVSVEANPVREAQDLALRGITAALTKEDVESTVTVAVVYDDAGQVVDRA